jgi:hypothetical protein
MNRMQEHLLAVAHALSLKIELNPAFVFSNGDRFAFDVLFPDLGAPNGMLVSDSHRAKAIGAKAHELVLGKGYGYSSWNEHVDGKSFDPDRDLESFIRVFSDWGWSGEDRKRPEWMIESADENDTDT